MEHLKFNLSSASGHKVDVMFLADSTGSMSAAMANVKADFLNAYQKFQKQTNWDVGVGIAYYKDVTVDPDPFVVLTPITTDSATITNAIKKLTPSGGGDIPEDQLAALQLLAARKTSGWRTGATRIIAWFGDEPGHKSVVYKGATYTIDSAIDALLERNVYVCAFSMAPSNHLDQYGQATKITNETNGVTNGSYLKSNVAQGGVTKFIFDFIGDHVF